MLQLVIVDSLSAGSNRLKASIATRKPDGLAENTSVLAIGASRNGQPLRRKLVCIG
jgi:hypothetical protein